MAGKTIYSLLGMTLGLLVSTAHAGQIDDIKTRGQVRCGVSADTKGFSAKDDTGKWVGFNVDFCRALAATVFNDPGKVEFVVTPQKERFNSLQAGDIDVLMMNVTWTMGRDTMQGLTFPGTILYDGQGFMVKKSLGVASALQLNGASVCLVSGTTSELNLGDFARANKITLKPVKFDSRADRNKAFADGKCDVLTGDQSELYASRLALPDSAGLVVLPEVISKEPVGPVVRQGDDRWTNIVQWTLFALINAEEMGVSSKNVDEIRKNTQRPDIMRLLSVPEKATTESGIDNDYGTGLGLGPDWAYIAIKAVGNYGEIFDRNIGPGTPINMERGKNSLWSKGGLIYAPPIR